MAGGMRWRACGAEGVALLSSCCFASTALCCSVFSLFRILIVVSSPFLVSHGLSPHRVLYYRHTRPPVAPKAVLRASNALIYTTPSPYTPSVNTTPIAPHQPHFSPPSSPAIVLPRNRTRPNHPTTPPRATHRRWTPGDRVVATSPTHQGRSHPPHSPPGPLRVYSLLSCLHTNFAHDNASPYAPTSRTPWTAARY